jgi:hypothetical protein
MSVVLTIEAQIGLVPESKSRAAGVLKMPKRAPYDRERRGSASRMFGRLALIFSIVAIGLVLDGCTKCGPIWDDWMSPKSCKSDHL